MKLSKGWVRTAVWIVLLLGGSMLVGAQEVTGSISGTVVDASGAVINGAVVTLTNADRAHVERTVKTNKQGFYTASSLPLGTYSVSITNKGFKTATVSGLVLHANDALKVDQKLEVGAETETVNIVANQAQLDLENGMSQGLVTGTQVRELVLNNRNYEQLITLQPGVSYGNSTNDQLYIGASLPSGTSAQVAYSINGSRPTANNWTIDGADNVDRGANLTLLAYPSVDAISEFKTLRGTYEAEYGRSASGQINVITRSGTNDYHGSAYEFFRNDLFNANNYFNKTTAVIPRPKLRYNDFGFTFGGPVRIPHLYNGKDKTFFFYSQEFRRVVQYASVNSYVPTAAERNGDFSNAYLTGSNGSTYTGATGPVAVCSLPGGCSAPSDYTTNLTGNSNLSPTAVAYVKDIYSKVPLPPSAADLAAGLDPHLLVNNIHNVFNDNQEFVRIDHELGKKVNVFYRYLHDDLPTTEGGGLFIGGGMPGVATTSTHSPGTQQMGHMTIAARPTLLIDMGYAYSYGAVISTPVGYVSSAASPDIQPTLPFTSTLGVVPTIAFTTGNISGITSNGIYDDHSSNHNGFGNITKVKGQHTLKFGLTYNHYQKRETATGTSNQGKFTFTPQTAPSSGTLTALGASAPSSFDSQFANFLIGNASGGFSQASLNTIANVNENSIELYGQDDWRVSPRLSVNLGVRYSYFGQPYDNNQQLSNFDPDFYNPAHAETIASTGNLCTLASQTTSSSTFSSTGVVTVYTLANCPNVNGLNPYQPNNTADPLNGIILGSPDFIPQVTKLGDTRYPFTFPQGNPPCSSSLDANAPFECHGSPWGQEVGHAEKHDWAPRIGFAYDLFGNGKTALRGGYGIAYDQGSVSPYETAIFTNPPYVNLTTFATADLDNAAGVSPVTNLTPPSLAGTPLIYQTPYVQQFSVDVQQAIGSSMMVDVGYFGDHGTHLLGVVDVNEVRPGAFATTSIGYAQTKNCTAFTSQTCEAPLNQIRPYLGYTAINQVQTIFNSNYNSLQVKVTKRFSGKSLIDANYTFSRGLTNAQNDYSSAPQNTYNLAAEYGPSVYNRNDILTIDGVWELPWKRNQEGLLGRLLGGWETSGLFTANSGLPLTATMSSGGTVNYAGLTSPYNGQTNGGLASDAAGLGILGPSAASLRPDMVLNPNSGYGQVQVHTRQHWFNQTAFLAPPPGSFRVGNEKRGVMNGPGFYRVDVGVFRNFRIYRSASFQLRGEAFNLLNHTNWGNPGTSATTSTFGVVTSTRDPRILQVAGKFTF